VTAAALLPAFAVSGQADPADTPFLRKWNAFATAGNQLRDELQRDVANLKTFRLVKRRFDAVFADEGWLK
jgi:hypothetical protein